MRVKVESTEKGCGVLCRKVDRIGLVGEKVEWRVELVGRKVKKAIAVER